MGLPWLTPLLRFVRFVAADVSVIAPHSLHLTAGGTGDGIASIWRRVARMARIHGRGGDNLRRAGSGMIASSKRW